MAADKPRPLLQNSLFRVHIVLAFPKSNWVSKIVIGHSEVLDISTWIATCIGHDMLKLENRLSRRKRISNFAMATLGLKEMGKFLWEGREKGGKRMEKGRARMKK